MKTLLFYTVLLMTTSVYGQGLINNGGYITASGSPYITIQNGSLDNNGTWTKATETLTFSGSTAGELKGSANNYANLVMGNSATTGITLNTTNVISCDNLTINASSVFTMAPTSKLTVNTAITNNGGNTGFVIKSDATGSGSLISGTAGVAATVEQHQTDGSAVAAYYHMATMPITSATAAVFKFTGVQSYVYSYNSTTPGWTNITTSATALVLGKGYLINYHNEAVGRTSIYTGNLNAGDVSPTLDNVTNRFNLIGNPYPCAINWDTTGWTRTNISNTYYLWQPASGNYGTYTINGGAGVSVNGLTRIIPSGQGFFVYSNGSNPAITIPSASKSQYSYRLKSASEKPSMIKLHISNNANPFSDEAVVLFSQQATTGFDYDLDAVKMFTLSTESSQIYTTSTKNLVINALPSSFNDSIPVFFKCNKEATYTLELNENTWKDSIWLTDLIANKTVLLTEGKYTFNALKTDTTSRFVINRKKSVSAPTGIEYGNPLKSGISIYAMGRKIILQNLTDKVFFGELIIYRVDGRFVHNEKSIRLETEIFRDVFSPGIYLVRYKEGSNIYMEKVVVF